jgi:hypothetical protein
MTKFSVLLCSLAVIAIGTRAVASPSITPMPNYDVGAFCTKDVTDHDCRLHQYFARLMASKSWEAITPGSRTECLAVNIHHNYFLLQDCVASHQDDGRVSLNPPSIPNYDIMVACAGKDFDSCAHDQYTARSFANAIWKYTESKLRIACLSSNNHQDYKLLDNCARSDQKTMIAAIDDYQVKVQPAKSGMPYYSVGDLCGNSNACWQIQTSFERWAATMWLDAMPAVRAECVDVNTIHDYQLLSMCLESHQKDKDYQVH